MTSKNKDRIYLAGLAIICIGIVGICGVVMIGDVGLRICGLRGVR
jgi:hypothetical protein